MGDGEVKRSTLGAIGAFFFPVEERKHDRDTREVTEEYRAISKDQDLDQDQRDGKEVEEAEDYGA